MLPPLQTIASYPKDQRLGGPSGLDVDAARHNPERVEAVVRTGLLDTAPEAIFDRLTRLAAKLVRVPATFISLVDETRDFYKSAFGFGEPLATERQLEGRTFCHYALASAGPLIIPDTLADPAYRDVPTVKSLGVRAYVGVPLITEAGQTIGSFCAIDFEPRNWSTLEIEILAELAESALREIKMRSALVEAERQTRLAQEATRSREEVLVVVAHDLRTPLNFIKMATQIIADDPTAKENVEMIARMDGAADLMNVLIADLLEVAKLDAGGLIIAPRKLSAQTLLMMPTRC